MSLWANSYACFLRRNFFLVSNFICFQLLNYGHATILPSPNSIYTRSTRREKFRRQGCTCVARGETRVHGYLARDVYQRCCHLYIESDEAILQEQPSGGVGGCLEIECPTATTDLTTTLIDRVLFSVRGALCSSCPGVDFFSLFFFTTRRQVPSRVCSNARAPFHYIVFWGEYGGTAQ